MRWPRLVASFAQSTQIAAKVCIDGIGVDGEPISGETWEGLCNWQDASIERYGKSTAETEVSASVYIDGDAFPEVAFVAGGSVEAFEDVREIVRCTKARNPDGTVNYTRLELR